MSTNALPDDHDLYFVLTGDTKLVAVSDLTPTKPPEDQPASVDVAEARMAEAAAGKRERRPPLSVFESPSGLTIRDGNATYGVAVRHGWKMLPVVVEATAA